MARPPNPARGRQPGSPPISEMKQTKQKVAVHKASLQNDPRLARKLLEDSTKWQALFKRLEADLKQMKDEDDEKRKLGKRVAKSFEELLKYLSKSDVQKTLDAHTGSAKVVKEIRQLQHGTDPSQPTPAPVTSVLVVIAFIIAALKKGPKR